jgi:hypothetical protein
MRAYEFYPGYISKEFDENG